MDKIIEGSKLWANIKSCVKVLLHVVMVLCYSDGMRGGNLDAYMVLYGNIL